MAFVKYERGGNGRGQPTDYEREKMIIDMCLNGHKTQQAIGDEFGVSRQRVQQILKRNGIKGVKNGGYISPEVRHDIIERYISGECLNDILREHGFARHVYQKIITEKHRAVRKANIRRERAELQRKILSIYNDEKIGTYRIAGRLGIPQWTVARIIGSKARSHKEAMRLGVVKRVLSNDEIANIRKMRASGVKVEDIARQYSRSAMTIYRVLRQTL